MSETVQPSLSDWRTTRDEPWVPGTPCWVDLSTPDVAAAQTFYQGLFGWQMVDAGPDFGHYRRCELEHGVVAGMMQSQDDVTPPSWNMYVAVTDAGATAAAVTANGGTMVVEPMPVGSLGTMAFAADPTGAVFGWWQAAEFIGFQHVNSPGAVVWNELASSDPQRARDFYAAVFGHTFTEVPGDPQYRTIDGDGPGGVVGGTGALRPGAPAGTPSHWLTYFAVADANEAAAKVTTLGGTVMVPPTPTPYGLMAVVADPHGAVFALMGLPTSV